MDKVEERTLMEIQRIQEEIIHLGKIEVDIALLRKEAIGDDSGRKIFIKAVENAEVPREQATEAYGEYSTGEWSTIIKGLEGESLKLAKLGIWSIRVEHAILWVESIASDLIYGHDSRVGEIPI